MFEKILMAYNGSREGKAALLQCCEIASFTKAETHLLAVAGMPSSMFLTEGFLPEELLEEEKKWAQEVLEEGGGEGGSRAGGTDRSARRCSTTHPAAFLSRFPGADARGHRRLAPGASGSLDRGLGARGGAGLLWTGGLR